MALVVYYLAMEYEGQKLCSSVYGASFVDRLLCTWFKSKAYSTIQTPQAEPLAVQLLRHCAMALCVSVHQDSCALGGIRWDPVSP